jgi:TRAP-type C4-dicarboxylate transport system permease large subunit
MKWMPAIFLFLSAGYAITSVIQMLLGSYRPGNLMLAVAFLIFAVVWEIKDNMPDAGKP